MRVCLSLVIVLSIFTVGCSTTLTGPISSDSSLVIGRVVINNEYPGRLGLMPTGTVERGITLEIKNKTQTFLIKATTDRNGYFMIPNIPQNTYFLSRVIFKGGAPGDEETMFLATKRGVFFVPVRGQIVDLGTYLLHISEKAEVTPEYEKPNPEAARAYLAEKYRGTPWLKRKFNP